MAVGAQDKKLLHVRIRVLAHAILVVDYGHAIDVPDVRAIEGLADDGVVAPQMGLEQVVVVVGELVLRNPLALGSILVRSIEFPEGHLVCVVGFLEVVEEVVVVGDVALVELRCEVAANAHVEVIFLEQASEPFYVQGIVGLGVVSQNLVVDFLVEGIDRQRHRIHANEVAKETKVVPVSIKEHPSGLHFDVCEWRTNHLMEKGERAKELLVLLGFARTRENDGLATIVGHELEPLEVFLHVDVVVRVVDAHSVLVGVAVHHTSHAERAFVHALLVGDDY